MVQKYKSAVTVYHEPFEFVMKAYELRFPNTELLPVFLGSEIIEEEKSEDESWHKIVRRCEIALEAPYMIKKIMSIECGYFIQTNILNRRERTLTITGLNETFRSRILIEESCIYYVHPEQPEWTCFEQQASLTIIKFWGFEKTVEKIGVKLYLKNIDKGKEVMHIFIKQLHDLGIHNVPIWTDPQEGIIECPKRELSLSFEKKDYLDSEYISCYIGPLNSMTESCLVELQELLRQIYHEKIPSYSVIYRFLQASDLNVGRAKEMLQHSIAWRKANEVDKIYLDYVPNPLMKKYFTSSWHGTDLNGNPLLLLSLSKLDVKGLLKSLGEEEVIRHVTFICEESLIKIKEACEKREGSPILGITMLVDVDGLSLKDLWSPWISLMINVIDICQANYPQCLTNLLITRVPQGFPLICTILRSMFDKIAKSKFKLFPSSDINALEKYISAERIPKFLGGPADSGLDAILEKSQIPTENYINGTYDNILWDDKGNTMETHRGNKLWSTSLYRSIYLNKDNPHEVVFEANNKDVIHWDFDVLKGDVVFTVFHVDKSEDNDQIFLTKQKKYSFVGISNGMCPLRILKHSHGMTPFLSSLEARSGTSLQDSLEVIDPGFYILQWSAHSNANIIQSKSKFMYYAQLLTREDICGSMSSLSPSFTVNSTTKWSY